MNRLFVVLFSATVALSACSQSPEQQIGTDGKPLPQVYDIRPGDTAKIDYRMLDAVNALRRADHIWPIQLDANLTAAAATHSRDMAIQNRPWHFGSDGSSPIQRVQRTGYAGKLLGENISETYETELQTLSAWMNEPDTRSVIMDPKASNMGFAWFQERNGKIWWTLVTGN